MSPPPGCCRCRCRCRRLRHASRGRFLRLFSPPPLSLPLLQAPMPFNSLCSRSGAASRQPRPRRRRRLSTGHRYRGTPPDEEEPRRAGPGSRCQSMPGVNRSASSGRTESPCPPSPPRGAAIASSSISSGEARARGHAAAAPSGLHDSRPRRRAAVCGREIRPPPSLVLRARSGRGSEQVATGAGSPLRVEVAARSRQQFSRVCLMGPAAGHVGLGPQIRPRRSQGPRTGSRKGAGQNEERGRSRRLPPQQLSRPPAPGRGAGELEAARPSDDSGRTQTTAWPEVEWISFSPSTAFRSHWALVSRVRQTGVFPDLQ